MAALVRTCYPELDGSAEELGTGVTQEYTHVELQVQDVLDVIHAGSYGLYEHIWTLNADDALSDAEKITIATEAVTLLIRDHGLSLARLIWPSEAPTQSLTLEEIDATSFQNPTAAGSYTALVRGRPR
jgi:hypothetical protein